MLIACEVRHSPSPTVNSAAPVAYAPPQQETIADAVFVGQNLIFCDEITRPRAEWDAKWVKFTEALKDAGKQDETLRRDSTCDALTGARASQATCTEPGFVRRIYDAATLAKDDRNLRKCVKEGGTWIVNDSAEALEERSRQLLNSLHR